MSDTLFNFIDPVISASVNILSGSGLTAVNIQRGTGSLVTPRAEIQVGIGSNVGHVHITSPSSSVFDAYEGTMKVMVVTNRKTNDTSHAAYVSKVANMLSNPVNFLDRMPYHQLLRVAHTGTAQSFNNEQSTDASTISLGFLIQVKPTAW